MCRTVGQAGLSVALEGRRSAVGQWSIAALRGAGARPWQALKVGQAIHDRRIIALEPAKFAEQAGRLRTYAPPGAIPANIGPTIRRFHAATVKTLFVDVFDALPSCVAENGHAVATRAQRLNRLLENGLRETMSVEGLADQFDDRDPHRQIAYL